MTVPSNLGTTIQKRHYTAITELTKKNGLVIDFSITEAGLVEACIKPTGNFTDTLTIRKKKCPTPEGAEHAKYCRTNPVSEVLLQSL